MSEVAIVDYGMGNLFSVRSACAYAGIDAFISGEAQRIRKAKALILPGVGAFRDAMATLRTLGLVDVLREMADEGRPILGICLGMQLLMTESEEFGLHEGLGILRGRVVRLKRRGPADVVKVPHVGWNRLEKHRTAGGWSGTLLDGLGDGTHMYFVHSYVVEPEDQSVVLATTRYGPNDFCSALATRNVFACQCHPERSGPQGLAIFENFARGVILHGGAESLHAK